MPNVIVKPGLPRTERTHDVMLDDGTTKLGFRLVDGNMRAFQKFATNDPMRLWADKQEMWTSGRGLRNFRDDPSGFADGKSLWGMTPRKFFPTPQWKHGTGTRVMDIADVGNVTFQPVYGSTLYVSRNFTAGASYTATGVKFLVRRVGTPGTLTYKLYTNSSGDPNAAVANTTVTKTVTNITDVVSEWVEFTFPSAQSLTSGTVYHHVLYGASTDNSDNHWEIGSDAATAGGDYSTDGSTWSEASFALYHVTHDADTDRRLFFFNMDFCTYCVTQPTAATGAQLYILGDRGTCSSASAAGATTLTDSAKSWVTDEFAGAMVRIVGGAGEGQVRAIASNTSTALTLTSGWSIALTTASKFVIYGVSKWREITGHGITRPTSRPAVGEKTAWIPQGTSVGVRRLAVNANTYNDAAETAKYDFITMHHSKTDGFKMYLGVASTGKLYKTTIANDTALSTPSAIGQANAAGSGDYLMTNLVNSADKIWVGKEDGMFYLENSSITEAETGVKYVPDPTNLLGMTWLGSTLFYSYGRSFAYMIGTETKDILNFRTSFDGLADDRKGYVSAAITYLNWVIIAVDGGADNYSSVLVWNGIGWNEIYRGWAAGVRIRDLWMVTGPDVRPRLWMDVAGHPVYMDFPKYVSNPRKDTTLPYQHEAVMVSGTYTVDKETDYKHINRVKITSENLGANAKIEVDYQMNDDVETNTWYPLGTVNLSPKQVIKCDIGEVLRIRFRLRLLSTVAITPAVGTSTEVEGSIASEPRYQYVFTFSVGQKTYDGQDDFLPSVLDNQVKEWFERRTHLTMRSILKECDDKDVVCSLGAPIYNSLRDGEGIGTFAMAVQET